MKKFFRWEEKKDMEELYNLIVSNSGPDPFWRHLLGNYFLSVNRSAKDKIMFFRELISNRDIFNNFTKEIVKCANSSTVIEEYNQIFEKYNGILHNMESKIKTSIQYQLSNNILFNEVFGNWNEFHDILQQGPNEMKKYLYKKWNYVKNKLSENKKIEIQDLNKVVTVDDFDITYNQTKNKTSIFFFTFPDYDYRDAASKYVALALTKRGPRYFTLEYSESAINHEPCWVIGEFIADKNGKVHKNLGRTDNKRLTWFAGYIMGLLEAEGL